MKYLYEYTCEKCGRTELLVGILKSHQRAHLDNPLGTSCGGYLSSRGRRPDPAHIDKEKRKAKAAGWGTL